MILLASTSDLLRVITSAASTVDVHASWIDDKAGVVTPGRTNTAITTATTTTVVASPADATTFRNVKTLTIRNKDASLSNAITVLHTDGTTIVDLWKGTLQIGEELHYLDAFGFRVSDATGAQKVAQSGTGRWLATTVKASGGTFTTGPQTTSIFVRRVGGGGGGGGCTSVASAAGAAGGGGAGSYAEKTFAVTPSTTYNCVVGSLGVGQSGAGGTNATASTFTVGAVTVTAPGGSGAPVATAATTLTARAGGAGGAIATNGDMNGAGQNGNGGIVLIVSGPILASGNGGSGPFGAGGLGLVAVGNGNVGIGSGAGGGGAATGAAAVRTGGNGTIGVIIVNEYA